MNKFLLLLFLFTGFLETHAQKPYTLILGYETLDSLTLNYRVVKVIDGRKDKSNVGWVQKGLSNKIRFAILEQPAEREIMDLLTRSQVMSTQAPDVILRLEYMGISEHTLATSERAKAEVTLDLFYVIGNDAWFMARKHATQESRGIDVTRHHESNIVWAIWKILHEFSMLALTPLPSGDAISIDDIGSYSFVKNENETIAPIFFSEKYPNGLYSSFEEFYNNEPSITEGYQVSPSSNTLKVRWLNKEGQKRRIKDHVYALAYENQLYIFFYGDFYPIEKNSRGFFFIGPPVPNSEAAIAGGILGGAIGGTIAGALTADRNRYKIDLTNGSLKFIGKVHR